MHECPGTMTNLDPAEFELSYLIAYTACVDM